MKLIASLTSPYARKVRIVLAEKKIDCPLEEDVPWNADTRVGDYNPLGKVPVLELDDGSTLYDSRVIAEYLDNISPVSRILPQENRLLIATRRWEALATASSTPRWPSCWKNAARTTNRCRKLSPANAAR
ncbi:glutathione S-transferase N-terminal domain-containing protein [Chromobacterium haemolyticum]|nr:glutathione S-transferase N-terminal domain-containing protein [Chromobacterium haemolyticum]